MKRHLREKSELIHERLKVYEKTRAEHRKRRKRVGLPTVGIVGYTNAGKSTLMNALTHKGVLAEDKLFATLGTSVGKMYVPPEDPESCERGTEILLNDTIGFIRDLPPDLIAAFSSTLEDSIESDLLLHVIDAADPKVFDKVAVVNETLEKIGAKQKRIFVFNKTDACPKERMMEVRMGLSMLDPDVATLASQVTCHEPSFVSAVTGQGLPELKRRILEELRG